MPTAEEFLEAARRASPDEVQALLAADPSLADSEDPKGISAVLWAAYHGRMEVAEMIAAAGAKLNVFEEAALGRLEPLRASLARDSALVHAVSPDGFTALSLAAFFGRAEIARALLEAGADPNFVSRNAMEVTPLHSAVANRDAFRAAELARLLVAHGADVTLVQQGGWTPLHQAAAHGHTRLADFLLDHGADPFAVAGDGRTPRDMAAAGQHVETARLLKERMQKGT